MQQHDIDSVKTKGITFAPIVRHYFERCAIAQIIDDNVPLDPRRKTLSHGQACIAMITGILCKEITTFSPYICTSRIEFNPFCFFSRLPCKSLFLLRELQESI